MQRSSFRFYLRVGLLMLFAAATAGAAVPSFPGALGFGAVATGGRTGTVYHVTNLNDSGTGSFRDAVSASGRIIVFDVGGYIHALSPISAKSNLTIAGQTAPGDGIGIYGCEVSFSGSTNDIVRYMRFRDGTQDPNYPGSSSTNSHTNAINLGSTTNFILDHCCMEFAAYNNVDATACVNLTIQDSIFANPIAEQRFNGHFETGPMTFIDNIWANSHGRNPLAKASLQFVNNVVYNYQYAFTTGNSSGHFSYDIINNYFIAGPSTSSAGDDYYQVDGNQSAYATGNILDGNKDGTLNGSGDNSTGAVVLGAYVYGAATASPTTSLPTLSPAAAFKYVNSIAGPLPRDQVDTQVVGNVQSLGKAGGLWTSETATGLGNGGYGVLNGSIPLTDSDRDGMPDVWESAVGLNPNSAADGNTVTASGYTNLEVYLNWLAAPHGIASKNTTQLPSSLDIDLRQYTAGYTGAVTFAVSSATNGAVSLLADGHTAHFVPTLNYFGLASYTFTVSDGSSTLSQTFGVLVSSSAPPVDLVWRGDGAANNWNTASSNWIGPKNVALQFGAGDGVTFDDTGSASPPVNLTGTFAPSEVDFNSSVNNYTLGGAGSLSGGMSLVMNGNATVTINTLNSFTGAVTLNSGNIALGDVTSLGSGPVTMGGVGMTLPSVGGTFGNPLIIGDSSAITWISNSNIYLSSTVTGAANLTLNFSNKLFTLQGSWAGYTGTVDTGTSTGQIRLNNANSLNFAAATVNLAGTSLYHHLGAGQAISFGALNGNANTVLSGSNVVGTGGTDTFTIGALNTNATYSGSIQNGAGATNLVAITKTGKGTLVLNGASTYTGPTAVNGGALVVNGSLGNTALTVTAGTLNGTGTIGSTTGGAVSMKSGTILSPGLTGQGNYGTLTVGNGLTLNGATVELDLSGNPSGSNDRIVMQGGVLTLSGASNVILNLVDNALGAGVYTLIGGGTSNIGGTGNLNANLGLPTGARQNFVASVSAGKLLLTVTGSPATLYWQGALNSGIWDANTTANWTNAGVGDKFFNFDAVSFTDAAATGNVVLSGIVRPRLITVANSALSYSFNGGIIAGTGSLVMNGPGTMTLTVPSVSVSATTDGSTAVVLANPVTAIFAGMTVSGTGVAAGTTVTAVTDSTHVTLSQAATAGTNVLTFFGINTYSGGTFINGGAIVLGSAASNSGGLGTGAITFKGGTLTMYSAGTATDAGTLSNPLFVNTSGTLNTAPRCTISSTLTGGGTLTYNTTYVRTALAGDWSAFTGEINVTGGGNFRITPSYGYPGFPLAGVNLNDGVSMYYAGTIYDLGTSIPVGELSGTSLAYLQGGPASSGARAFTWIVGGRNTDAIFAGTIAEQSAATTQTSIYKVGSGMWTLTGTTNLNGDLLIQQGMLRVSGSVTNGGNFEAQGASTFNLNGGVITTDTVQIDGGANMTGCGTINGNLSSQGSVFINCGGTLTVNGDLENDGTLRVTNGSALAVSGRFTNTGLLDLMTGAQTLPANFTNSGVVLDSSLVKVKSASKAGGTFTVSVQTYAGHTYQVQSKAALGDPQWTNVTGNISSSTDANGVMTFTITGVSASQMFYRIAVGP